MNITSKFDIGAEVWAIGHRHEQVWTVCGACAGAGSVELKNGMRTCPDCYGKLGSNKSKPMKWMLEGGDRFSNPLTVGQVRLEVESSTLKEQYMCHETGVGSGTLWPADSLFASHEEAQAVCDEKNASGDEVTA